MALGEGFDRSLRNLSDFSERLRPHRVQTPETGARVDAKEASNTEGGWRPQRIVRATAPETAPQPQPLSWRQPLVYIAIRPSNVLVRLVRRLVAFPTMLSIAENWRV